MESKFGAPAHAGMVPPLHHKEAAMSRCPRPRGDGPLAPAPHASAHAGAPAHAGMVPSIFRLVSAALRCPRPRGDGPSSEDGRTGTSEVPPPTRGWCVVRGDPVGERGGAPAHAGMVLAGAPGEEALARCPRPRGDGPRAALRNSGVSRVPPPTRGWSRLQPPVEVRCLGAPYPRGDGPHATVREEGELRGAPAHAGMAGTTSPPPPTSGR